MSTHDADAIRNLDERMIKYHGLRRGDLVTFETISVSMDITTEREWRFGANGINVKRISNRQKTVLESVTLKLWKTEKKGWYWK